MPDADHPADFPLDLEAIQTYLNTVFEPGDYVEFRAIMQQQRGARSCYARIGEPLPDSIVAWLDAHHSDRFMGMYVGANPRQPRPMPGPGHASSDSGVLTYRCAFIDSDTIGPNEIVKRIEDNALPEPTLIIHSGRETGSHVYWRFAEPMDEDVWRGVQRALQARFNSDAVKDPSRVMRLPGTYNFTRDNNARILRQGPTYKTSDDLGLSIEETLPPVARTQVDYIEPSERNFNFTTQKYLDADRIPEGGGDHFTGRNNALFSVACDFFANNFSVDQIEERLLPLALKRDGMNEREARRTIRNAGRRDRLPTMMPGINAVDLTIPMVARDLTNTTRGMAPPGAAAESPDDVPDLVRILRPMTEDEIDAAHPERDASDTLPPPETASASDLPTLESTTPVATATLEKGEEDTDTELERLRYEQELADYSEAEESVPVLLANYRMGTVENARGKAKSVKEFVPLGTLRSTVASGFGGWPKTAPGMGLFGFAVDSKTGDERIYSLVKPATLFSFLKANGHITWTGEDVLYRDRLTQRWLRPLKEGEFFENLLHDCPNQHAGISELPHEPPLAGFFYPKMELPEPSPNHGCIIELLDSLNPETPEDRALLLAAMVTPGWGGPPGARPLFVVASDHGQGSGKTATLKAISEMWGGYYPLSLERPWADNAKAMMSSSDWLTRIAAWDNVKGKFSAGEIEGAVTSKTIQGHRMYVGTMKRYNDITFFVTFNVPDMSRDLAQRAVVIKLGRPKAFDFATWWNDYLAENRRQLLADALSILARPMNESFDFGEYPDRWRAWQRGVLSRLPETDLGKVMATIVDRREDVDSETDDAIAIVRAIAVRLKDTDRGEGVVPFSLLEARNLLMDGGIWKMEEKQTLNQNNRRLSNFIVKRTTSLGVISRVKRAYLNVDENGRDLGGRSGAPGSKRSPRFMFDWSTARSIFDGDDLQPDAGSSDEDLPV